MIVDYLTRRAKRTPYFDLPGYMRRNWLVPYNSPIQRVVNVEGPDPDLSALPGDAILSYSGRPGEYAERKIVYFDGTGPVNLWRRPIARLLQKLGIAVRVHEILRSDDGRDPHDHPWGYVTVILKGGYFETRYSSQGVKLDKTWHGPGSILYRPAGSWHRLDVPNGMVTTTLFITGPKVQSWGFNVDGKKVPYYEYLEKKGDA